MVSSKALSRFVCRSFITARKCYRVDHDDSGAVKLTFVGDTGVPFHYEYIKLPQ